MSTTTAYGSITIVDITDVGEFSVQPESNMPLSVIYDPDSNTYTPNWKTSPLVIKPVIYYAGKQLTSNVTVTWQRQNGGGSPVDLINGVESKQNNNNLSVSDITAISNTTYCSTGLLTYICTATYTEPLSGVELTAKGQITFSLMKNAAKVRKCQILGESVLKYNASGIVNGTGNIVLRGEVGVVTINKWQYQTGVVNGVPSFADYPTGTINASTLIVSATHNVFINDVATIKLLTNDDNVYDIHTITKLRDGAPGDKSVAAVLTNDDQWIACDSNGNPLSGAFDQAYSTITIYEGGVDVTNEWTINNPEEDGVSGSYNRDLHTYTADSITKQSAKVQFTCTRTGYDPIYKDFTLTKLIAAKDGETPTIHSVSPDVYAINRSEAGVYTPASITFYGYSQTGTEDKKLCKGIFKIYVDNSESPVMTTGNNVTSCLYTPTDKNVGTIRCDFYEPGGNIKWDSKTVVVTSDGVKGDQGIQGKDGRGAVNVVIGNQSDIISCDKDGKVLTDTEIIIPFTGYEGITQVACKFQPGTSSLPSGMTSTYSDATTTASGQIKLLVAKGATLGSQPSGTIALQFQCMESLFTHYYRWSKNIQAADGTDGQNAVLLQIYAPYGNVIENGENDVTLEAYLVDGSTEVTNASYKWYKYSGDNYNTQIKDENNRPVTTSSVVIAAGSVSGYASYKCEATYNGTPYVAYYAVYDKTDPIQAYMYSSVGTQLVNKQGKGAIYTKIFRNGKEIDEMKSERFLTTAPTPKETGEFYYHLGNKTCTLMKYNGSEWVTAGDDDLPKATYTYTFRDKDYGIITYYDNRSFAEGKAVYIDGDLVDQKIIIDVSVEV